MTTRNTSSLSICKIMRASLYDLVVFFFSSRRRHTRFDCDWSSDVCSSDLPARPPRDASGGGDGGAAGVRAELAMSAPSSIVADFRLAPEGAKKIRWVAQHEVGRASCRERG